MPNYFHLLLRTEDEAISIVMKRLISVSVWGLLSGKL